MFINEYFKTPIWMEEKPEFVKSLTKATDQYIKEAKKLRKDDIKKNGEFGTSYHSTPLTVDTKFRDFHNYVGQKAWEFLDWQGFAMQEYTTFFSESWVQEFAKMVVDIIPRTFIGINMWVDFIFLKQVKILLIQYFMNLEQARVVLN
jgi:hypothetical protein